MDRRAIKYKTIIKKRLASIKPLNDVWLEKKIRHLKSLIEFSYSSGTLRLVYHKQTLVFRYSNKDELEVLIDLINDIFAKEEYRELNVEGKCVVDIGSNIGDSALYFAARGAKHVYCFEPSPYACKIANINLNLNRKMKKRITVVNAGLGNTGYVSVEDSANFDPGNVMNATRKPEASQKKKVKVYGLADLFKIFRLGNDSVLKIDCEGCEYDMLKKINSQHLAKFGEIILEYHSGYQRIKELLEGMGYDVSHTKPALTYNYNLRSYMELGILYARKRGKRP